VKRSWKNRTLWTLVALTCFTGNPRIAAGDTDSNGAVTDDSGFGTEVPTDSDADSVAGPDAMTPAQAADASSVAKLTVHGYLTQAYAVTDYSEGGPAVPEVNLGIPEGGTTNYRQLALQFRYQIRIRGLRT
jgi:hypothetical protein